MSQSSSTSDGPRPCPRPRPHLTTLPLEIRQMIFRHLYPVSDMTLLPSTHPSFRPRSLTLPFNVRGNSSPALLQTCSALCAAARPIRDAAFTGVLNAVDIGHLARAGNWLHLHARAIRLLVPGPDVSLRIHLELFARVRRVELAFSRYVLDKPVPVGRRFEDVFAAASDVVLAEHATSMAGQVFYPVKEVRDRPNLNTNSILTVADSARFFQEQFSRTHLSRRDHFPDVELVLRLRYVAVGSDGVPAVVGAIVRKTNAKTCVVQKVARIGEEFAVWDYARADALHTVNDNNDGRRTRPRPYVVQPVCRMPRKFAWVKFKSLDVNWGDIEGWEGGGYD